MFKHLQASAALLLTCSLRAQTVAPIDRIIDPPKPGCDSYSMETLPKEAFRFKQRACYWGSQLFTGSAIFGASLFGAIGEWRHKPPEWSQGWQGFSEQMGTRYTQGMVKNTATFLVSTISREDPRDKPPPLTGMRHPNFGCRPSTTFKSRLGRSLLRVVWDPCEGAHGAAPGRLIGSFASGFVGLAWAPPSQDKISDALVNSGTAFAGYIGSSVFSEFQYDIYGLIGKMFAAGKPHIVTPKAPSPPNVPTDKGGQQ